MSQMFKFPVPAQLVISNMSLNTTITLTDPPAECPPECTAECTEQWKVVAITGVGYVVSSLIIFFLQRAYLRLRKICKKKGEERKKLAKNTSEVDVEMDTFHSARSTSIESFQSAKSRLS